MIVRNDRLVDDPRLATTRRRRPNEVGNWGIVPERD